MRYFKLPIAGDVYFFICLLAWLVAALVNQFVYQYTTLEVIELMWVGIIALPLLIPLNKLVDIKPIWRNLYE